MCVLSIISLLLALDLDRIHFVASNAHGILAMKSINSDLFDSCSKTILSLLIAEHLDPCRPICSVNR